MVKRITYTVGIQKKNDEENVYVSNFILFYFVSLYGDSIMLTDSLNGGSCLVKKMYKFF